ncbi:XdhC family protein [Microvirga terrae]|uniref:XdhC family protein n=1 Tax=Microvirga terrae TaxID=2740529 RepID=A0ABY5RXE5_9HYPH|nr:MULTISPECIES: XdhC family protein [Microvirga]MBQ0822728.1 XdhC family protein [Microvirga sp. HBU67558]UVF20452.1 XdhC family protein [Microvirga terrae]
MNLDLLTALNKEGAARRAAVLITEVDTGRQRLVRETDVAGDPLRHRLEEHLDLRKSGLVEQDGRQFFLNVQVPSIKLLVIGAVHVGQALAPMAAGLDLAVTIIDPRSAFATPERFPGVNLLPEWPDDALTRIGLDRHTAVLTLTHDPKIDDRALVEALRSDCFYIGALGSRKSHAQRLDRLRAGGFGEEDLARIHGPVGLNIGAVSPAEIAVSILAEIISLLRRERRIAREAASR